MTLPVAILFVILGLSDGVLAQEIYRWVNEKGIVNFTDNLHSIPEKYRGASEKKVFPPSPEIPTPAPRDDSTRLTEPTPRRPGVSFRRWGGEIIVEGFINQKGPVDLVVDQGAMITSLPASVAAQLGIDFKNSLPIPWQMFGRVASRQLVAIDQLRVGDAESEGLEIAISERVSSPYPFLAIDKLRLGNAESEGLEITSSERVSSPYGLLGRDFLEQFRVEGDYKSNWLELVRHRGPYGGYSAKWWQEKFRFYRRLKQTYENHIHKRREDFDKLKQQGPIEYEGYFAAALQRIHDEIVAYQGHLRTVIQKLGDLDRRASYLALPRELRD